MGKDPDTSAEVQIGHAIRNQFIYTYKDRWVPQKTLFQKDRQWVKVFNRLVRDGLIERRKTFSGYTYRWRVQ